MKSKGGNSNPFVHAKCRPGVGRGTEGGRLVASLKESCVCMCRLPTMQPMSVPTSGRRKRYSQKENAKRKCSRVIAAHIFPTPHRPTHLTSSKMYHEMPAAGASLIIFVPRPLYRPAVGAQHTSEVTQRSRTHGSVALHLAYKGIA